MEGNIAAINNTITGRFTASLCILLYNDLFNCLTLCLNCKFPSGRCYKLVYCLTPEPSAARE